MAVSSTQPRLAAGAGQRHDARQRARRLHDGQFAVAAKGILALQAHDEVEALVLDARERAGRIEPERDSRPARPRARSTPPATRRVCGLQSARPSSGTPSAARRRQQHLVQAPILLGDQPQGALVDRRRAAPGSSAVRGELPAPSSSSCLRPATRISKNSSRLPEEMHRNFSRSSSGTDLIEAPAPAPAG